MATYKGIGYDTSAGKTRTGTSADDISFDALITATDGISVTAIGINVAAGGVSTNTLTVSGDASIGGDLTVTGDVISRGAVDLVIQDNFIDLNFANSTTTAEAGGLTVQMNRTSGFTAGTVTTFVAGAAGVSNPTFTYTDATGSSLFVAGDVVVIAGATEAGNDGLFVVNGVNQASFPQIVTIKGIGTAAVNAATPWAQNQFEASSGDTATAFKTDLFVQLVADGTNAFQDSGGSTYSKGTFLTAYHSNATESSFSANGGYTTVESTLQSAYNGGNQITTTAASTTPITFVLSEDNAGFVVDGDAASEGNVLFGSTNTINKFTVDTGAEISFDAAAASNFTTSGGALTLDGAGGINIVGNSAEIDLTTSGALDLNCAAATLDATGGFTAALSGGPSGIVSTSQNFTLQTATSGDIDINSAATLDIDCVAAELTATGGLTGALSGAASSITSTGQNLTVETASSGNLVLTSAATLDINSVACTFDATGGLTAALSGAASSITSTAQNLSIATATSGEIDITSAGNLDLNGVATTIDGSAGVVVTGSGAASSFTSSGQNLTLQTATSGDLVLNAAGAVDIDAGGAITANTTANDSIRVQAGTASTATGVATVLSSFPMLVKLVVANTGNLLRGDVVTFTDNGAGVMKAVKADADASSSSQFAGVCITATTAGQDAPIAIAGNVDLVLCDDTFNAANHLGKKVYLSETAGKVTISPPTGTGDVVYQVGICTGGSGTNWQVLLQPQFIMEIG